MTTYGIIGFGCIGKRVAARLRGPDAPRLLAVLVRVGQEAEAQAVLRADATDEVAVCTRVEDFIAARPRIAVEAASGAALAAFGPALLAAGIDLVPLSLAVLADRAVEARLRAAALAGPGRIELAAGAMAALDFLATARENVLTRVVFRAAYPAFRWSGTPAEALLDLARMTAPAVFFRGTVREAAQAFPRHLNVCVGVALAGLGLDGTEAELIADPSLRQAAFEVEAEAEAGAILLRVAPRDAPAGADPVDHTAFSVMQVLRRRAARMAI